MRALPVALLLVVACRYEVPPDQLPGQLRPVPGARDVVARSRGNAAGAEYKFSEKYPATNALREIESRFEPSEWQPRKFDHLNPTIPTSHYRGWQDYYSNPEKAWIHHWASEWQNKAGDIVSYDLMYKSPGVFERQLDTPTTEDVQVYTSYIPGESAKEQEDWAKRRAGVPSN